MYVNALRQSFTVRDIAIPKDCEYMVRGYFSVARISRTLPLGDIYMPDYRDMKILTLPEPLEVVKNWFKFSGVQQVIFPPTVKKICRRAFAGCKKLTQIRFEGES